MRKTRVPGNGGYEVGELLGEGGMGRVYRGRHAVTGRAVALKVLRDDYRGTGATRGLLQEAAAAARLSHPGIVDLIDLIWDGASPVLVMELVEGTSVEAWVQHWPGWSMVRAGLLEVLDALAAAHAAGVVHRDLKPSNLLIRHDGRVRIADFGIARVVDPLRTEKDGPRLAGTPLYMAPEQFERGGDVGPWTDLYAFGGMLWELLRGAPPFDGDLRQLILHKNVGVLPRMKPRPQIRTAEPLEPLLSALLDPQPRRRMRFAAHAAAALRDVELADHASEAPASSVALAVTPAVSANSTTRTHVAHRAATHDTVIQPEQGGDGVAPTIGRSGGRQGSSLLRLRTVPIAGRRGLQHRIRATVERVGAVGRVAVVSLVGPAGVGKSRLAHWTIGEVEREGLMEGAGAGYDLSGASRQGGLRHAVARLAGPPTAPWVTLTGIGEDDLAALGSWLGGGNTSPREAARMTRIVVESVARVRPVLLWLDDFGWADDGALELVEDFLERDETAVVVLCTVRSGTTEHPRVRDRLTAILGHPSTEVHEVTPLSQTHIRELVASVLPLEPELSDAVASRIDGTPLVVLSQLYDWVEQGKLELRDGRWDCAEPDTMDELLSGTGLTFEPRLAAFVSGFEDAAELALSVLLHAAALGDRFDEQLLAAAAAHDEQLDAMVPQVLDRALLAGILRYEPGGSAHYRFDHGLLREYLMETLSTTPDRGPIARAVGETVRQRNQSTETLVRTAKLMWLAGEHESAIIDVCFAAMARVGSGWFQGGRELEDVARQWVDEMGAGDDSVARAHVEFATARRLHNRLAYADALAMTRQPPLSNTTDPMLRSRVQSLTLDSLLYMDRFSEAERYADDMLRNLDPTSEDPGVLGSLWTAQHTLMEIAILRDDMDRASSVADELVRQVRSRGRGWRTRMAEVVRLDVRLCVGDDGDFETRARELLRASRADDDPITEEGIEGALLRYYVLKHDWEEAQPRLATQLARHERENDRWRLTETRVALALVASHTGDDEQARAASELATGMFDAVHTMSGACNSWPTHYAAERWTPCLLVSRRCCDDAWRPFDGDSLASPRTNRFDHVTSPARVERPQLRADAVTVVGSEMVGQDRRSKRHVI